MPETRQSSSARSFRRWRWLLLVVIAVGVAGSLYGWKSSSNAVPKVQVERVTSGPVNRVLAVNGKIAARDSVQIRSAVSATVLELMAAEGDRVEQGAVLARLDDRQQQAIVQQARATLEAGRLQQAQAVTTYERDRELGAIIARSKLEDAKLALDAATQEVARLTALLDQATIQLSRFTVLAPMTGTIIARSVDPGQLVDPTTALFTLADLSVLLLETDVDETYATQIARGQPATLQLVGSREKLEGSVDFVAPRVDPATGGLAVKIAFATPLSAPVGLTVTANILVDTRDGFTVPRTALQGDAVFLLVGNRAILTPVTVIDWPADRLIVTEGLADGDRLILDSKGLTDGVVVAEVAP